MFNDDNVVVGLEIGTHKICAAVGEMNEDGSVNIIGMGQSKSNGVRKGEICDPEKVETELRTAIDEAEKMANAELRNVFLGVSGGALLLAVIWAFALRRRVAKRTAQLARETPDKNWGRETSR